MVTNGAVSQASSIDHCHYSTGTEHLLELSIAHQSHQVFEVHQLESLAMGFGCPPPVLLGVS